MKRPLILLLLSTNCLAVQVTTTELSTEGNNHFVSTVWTVDVDIDEYINVRWGSYEDYNGGTFTLIHNGVTIFTGIPSYDSYVSRYEITTAVHIKKGDTLQGLIDSNLPAGSTNGTFQVVMTVGDGLNGKWKRTEYYKIFNYICNATVPVAIELGEFNPGTRTSVSIPLQVSSRGKLRFNVENDKGIIPLKRDADTIFSLDLSSYYDATYNSILWTEASGTTINGTVIVPQNSVGGGRGSVTGNITLNCE